MESNCGKDPCYQLNCKFTEGSACGSGKCCKSSRVLPAGTLCRASTSDCDLSRIATGLPLGVRRTCTYRMEPLAKMVLLATSHSKQCQHLFGRVARAAPLECFKAVNTRGDCSGNCGVRNSSHFAKCSIENVLRCRIQCENICKVPVLQDHVLLIQTHVGDRKCWGLDYHRAVPIADVGAVEDGTSCSRDTLCINRTCTSISLTMTVT